MRRVADAPVALRNDRRAIQRALAHLTHEHKHRPRPSLKRPDLRDIIPQRTPYPLPESTLDAVADLLDLDLEFLLFRHARTGEDVVVYRRDDGRIGLLHPPDSPLGDENDIVVPSRVATRSRSRSPRRGTRWTCSTTASSISSMRLTDAGRCCTCDTTATAGWSNPRRLAPNVRPDQASGRAIRFLRAW